MILPLLLLASVYLAEAAESSCAIQKGPYQPLTVYDIRHVDESLETVRTGPLAGCSVCCPQGWNECDDGSCMPPDIFCRYPESCCLEKYCGKQCTKDSGAACGAFWAPANFTCCSPFSGQLCAKPDICCGNHCCPDTHFCCSNETCCQKDTQICCNGLCCKADQECCGDHCCDKGEHDVCQSHVGCCPGVGRLCNDKLCCPQGDICHTQANKCCPSGQWCPLTSVCCPENTYCNHGGGCCQNGYHYCPGGARTNCHRSPYDTCCSDGSACTSDYPHCTGNGYCCPAGYPHYCPERNECFSTYSCSCCPDGGCCTDGNQCVSNGQCQYCYQSCHHSWWSGTHCHTECDHRDSVSHYGAILASGPMLPDENAVNPPRGMKPIRAASAGLDIPIPAAAKFLSSIKDPKFKIQKPIVAAGGLPPFVMPPGPHKLINKNSTACWANGAIGTNACGLLECLENMMINCGGNNSIVERHKLYCSGYDETWNLFNKAGQAFLTATRECIFKQYVAAFKDGVGIPCCENLDTWGSCMDYTCWIDNHFCTDSAIFYPNVHAFEKLMEMYGTDNIFNIYFNQCQGKPCHD